MAAVDMLEKNHNSKAETISKQSIGNLKKNICVKKKDFNLMVNIQTLDKLFELRAHMDANFIDSHLYLTWYLME